MGFSVLMSIYKKEKPNYFERAIGSVLNQTMPPDEIVIIEDGPLTEKLYEIIDRYQKEYPIIKTYKFENNVQLGKALAKGVELCNNELIARMDTDDIAVSNRFEKQYNYMLSHMDVSACGGWMEEFNDNDGNYHRIKKMPSGYEEIKKYARYRNPLNHMTVMFRKTDVLNSGNYMHYPFLEDYYLWTRMLYNGYKLDNIQSVLVKARTNDGLYERRGGLKYCKKYLKLRKIQRKLQLLNPVEYMMSIILTLIITLQPSNIRKAVYQRLLRR